jgi:3-hydroxy-9,10-secoandrosta-1,3,5(10)-triene-9,17-dione monooxygenase
MVWKDEVQGGIGMAAHTQMDPELETLSRAIDPIAETLSKRAAAAERARKPADESIAELEATGLFSLLVPEVHGGMQRPLSSMFEPIARLGEGCPSTAWVASFYVAHSWIASLFPEEARRELFEGKPYVRAPAPFAPTGTATRVDGGYRLTGRWRWGTGVMHADWVFAAGLTKTPDDLPEARLFALRASDVRVDDTWFVSGMAATGSNDIVIEDAFVPAHRTIPFEAFRDGDTPGSRDFEDPLYRIPMPPLLAFTAALPALGAARASVRTFLAHMKRRYMAYENKHQEERPAAQMRLARAAALADAAELLLRDLGARIDASTTREAPLTTAERGTLRMTAATAVHFCKDAIELVAEAAGSSAYFLDHPLQRMLRDVTVMATHVVFDWDGTSEMYGRVLLGRKPGTVLV